MIHNLDLKILYFVNKDLLNPVFNYIATYTSHFKTTLPLIIILAIIFLLKFKKRGLYLLLVITLSVILSDLLSNKVFKPLFHRDRPCVHLRDLITILGCNSSYSFISSHAANIMAAGLPLFLFIKDIYFKLFIVFVVLLVSFSRVYLGVHYPSDVIGGYFVGGIISIIVIYLFKKLKLF